MTFFGRSEVDNERVFIGVSSLRCKRRILTQEAHLKPETPEFVTIDTQCRWSGHSLGDMGKHTAHST
jgi:hypothetical protein